jgi:hypothetical protein
MIYAFTEIYAMYNLFMLSQLQTNILFCGPPLPTKCRGDEMDPKATLNGGNDERK